ncbi:molybdopterin-binding protein [Ochrobactrum pecoris]|uniref:Molybdenum cofactor cytidylyltransferase n=1 Tax=Brucella pecoris TaxID=867683 RepID=A0A5C5CP89_9HYPH|nr:molybdenum cofactor cytidylyltransferase [Brucella pecoris]NKW79190.1 molybdopterin-binding protein [Brucella pecoris]TNV12988.1 molybdopterin biosynthesis enzyme [Brucella pecoris]
MIFAEMPLDEAEGTILGYAITAGALTLRKGTVLDALNLALLREAGIGSVLAARLEKGDIGEDEAALTIGRVLASAEIEIGNATTGRVNLHARRNGVFSADIDRIDTVNAHDVRISVATLRNHMRVEAGQMIATVKIIPFAVPETLLQEIGLDRQPALHVYSFNGLRIGLIQSRLPSIRETVLEKTRELMEKRAVRNGGTLVCEKRVAHDQSALAVAIADVSPACDIIVIFSASAVADEADIVPQSIRISGGEILRIGMPVDPGNLLVLGQRDGKYIVAAPGSARSARENSLDWVLDRLMAGIALSADDLSRMGVGGLVL